LGPDVEELERMLEVEVVVLLIMPEEVVLLLNVLEVELVVVKVLEADVAALLPSR